jgi:hypothetical protein
MNNELDTDTLRLRPICCPKCRALGGRCMQSQEINGLRVMAVNTPINISVDVCFYNSKTITIRRKMGQNALQAIGIAVEQQRDRKQIVSMYIENKLCWEGAKV